MNLSASDIPTAVSTRSPWRRGFTMIEILVVVSIIAVLVTMLVSVSSSIRQAQDEKVARQDVKVLHAQVEAFRETYGRYPSEWTVEQDAGWAALAPEAQIEAAKRNCAWLILQLERDRKIRTILRESFKPDRYKSYAYDLNGDGTQEQGIYLMDGFGEANDEYRAFNYLKEGGAGGTPIVYSAGPDHLYHETADNIRSDDLNDR